MFVVSHVLDVFVTDAARSASFCCIKVANCFEYFIFREGKELFLIRSEVQFQLCLFGKWKQLLELFFPYRRIDLYSFFALVFLNKAVKQFEFFLGLGGLSFSFYSFEVFLGSKPTHSLSFTPFMGLPLRVILALEPACADCRFQSSSQPCAFPHSCWFPTVHQANINLLQCNLISVYKIMDLKLLQYI
ncbi:Hypothetical_protein [Hexamita inflata]|uniref:Hypothetical_protein n=1 Tax=Hexamita inflata TaxID=28002 RepID=A0AA86TY79_9EUKA|nr:Hypothetical protein HINF_LOCUS20924 [Hexamita inflata]